MKSIIKLLSIIIFLLVSMFYTNKSINILKENDPIMKKIKSTKEKYEIDPVNAIINEDEIISGIKGKTIDYKTSYNKMKRYGTYNESLTVLKDTTPTISIENNYDKYLVKGNEKKRNISLVFILNKEKNIDTLIKLLNEKDIQVTFFIDGTISENNINLIKQLTEHEIEVLSYNNNYDEGIIKTTISYLESITNKKALFCYTEEENKKLLEICKKNKLHTIKPTKVITNQFYQTIKKQLLRCLKTKDSVNSGRRDEENGKQSSFFCQYHLIIVRTYDYNVFK